MKQQEVNSVVVFENPKFGKVRTLTDNQGEPLFCGKDLCDALNYKKADVAVRQHVDMLDVTKRYVRVETAVKRDGSVATRQVRMIFVNESGFYALLFGSKLPAAKQFKRWVTSEVLPQIRKNGCYQLKQEMLGLEQQKQGLQQEVLWLEQQVDKMLPKVLYTDNVLDSVSCYTTTQVAKELGITAQELNRSLCAAHVQYYQSGQYMLYADFAHLGLAKSRTHYQAKLHPLCDGLQEKLGAAYTRTYLVWTEKGRKFIHDLAKRYLEMAQLMESKF